MSVNKVILVGNVGKDPEVRLLDGGTSVASITLATSEKGYKTKSGVDIPEYCLHRTDYMTYIERCS